MSGRRRGNTYHVTKGHRQDSMARKRDERVVRAAYRKERQMNSYLADDENFGSFSTQLSKLGLQLRDIPGDGNCLFRALGDQLEGHGRNHMKHRLDVAQYMLDHRKDFEPFVEDDIPFERHIALLKKPGTFAGNDAIVAFARLYAVNVVIHQLNSPCWQIHGTDSPSTSKQVHITYHNGEHYSSVRKQGDNCEAPSNVRLQLTSSKSSAENNSKHEAHEKKQQSVRNNSPTYLHTTNLTTTTTNTSTSSSPEMPEGMARAVRDISDVERHIMVTTGCNVSRVWSNVPARPQGELFSEGTARVIVDAKAKADVVMSKTGCRDQNLVRETLEEYAYDVDSTIDYILHVIHMNGRANNGKTHSPSNSIDDTSSMTSYQTSDSGIWSDHGTGTRIFGGGGGGGSVSSEAGSSGCDTPVLNGYTGAKPKTQEKNISKSDKKKLLKLEKKKRAEERHREKVTGGSRYSIQDEGIGSLAREVGTLQI